MTYDISIISTATIDQYLSSRISTNLEVWDIDDEINEMKNNCDIQQNNGLDCNTAMCVSMY